MATVSIFDSTANKVSYKGIGRVSGALPVFGIAMFFINHVMDEDYSRSKQLTPQERMATHYFRWRELTTSFALTAVILFITAFAIPDISTAVKVNLAISGGVIGFTSILTGCVAHFYMCKALGLNITAPPKGNTARSLSGDVNDESF